MAKRNYQYEKRQKELAKKKKKEEKRLRKLEKKEAEGLIDADGSTNGGSEENPEIETEDSPDDPVPSQDP